MAKTFIIPDIKKKLDHFYGCPPNHVINYFQNRIKEIKDKITNYQILIEAIEYQSKIKTSRDMDNFLSKCVRISMIQEYTKKKKKINIVILIT